MEWLYYLSVTLFFFILSSLMITCFISLFFLRGKELKRVMIISLVLLFISIGTLVLVFNPNIQTIMQEISH